MGEAGEDARGDGRRAPGHPGRARSFGSAPSAWVSSTYFAEGFPYSVVNNLVEILFKELGASLQVIGLTALFHLPWNLKFLWGPFLDQYETKRAWIVAAEIALSAVLVALALTVGAASALGVISLCVAALAILSATHDIAIDGYYLEGLDERGQSQYVGYRAAAYRIASLVVASPLLLLIGAVGWSRGLLAAAGVMVLLTLYHAVFLPRVETRRASLASALGASSVRGALVLAGVAVAVLATLLLARGGDGGAPASGDAAPAAAAQAIGTFVGISLAGWISLALLAALVAALLSLDRIRRRFAGSDSPYAAAFVDFLAQRRIGLVLLFIVSFRVGESFLVKMRWPFLHDVLGMSISTYAWANGTLGTVASFVATFLGGRLIARDGLRRWIWPFMLLQNALNLMFVGLAWLGPAGAGQALTVGVIAFDAFGSGLGTAVFMVYLMRCCAAEHRAAHMAIVTALMSVSFTLAGVGSGFLAAGMGFGPYFLFTFLVTIPGMALVLFLPHLDGREETALRAGRGGASA
ncbi:MAG: AmpG family muropeptide MFS transporter [Deltaproteobacteria bacterium]|nr:AmpG family muropeptide MFS transporter [Deltaproteobacteria bacterium]